MHMDVRYAARSQEGDAVMYMDVRVCRDAMDSKERQMYMDVP